MSPYTTPSAARASFRLCRFEPASSSSPCSEGAERSGMRLGTVGSLTSGRAYTESALDRAGSGVVEFDLATTPLDLGVHHGVIGVVADHLRCMRPSTATTVVSDRAECATF